MANWLDFVKNAGNTTWSVISGNPIAALTTIGGLIGSIADPQESPKVPQELLDALEQLNERAKEGLSSKEEAAFLKELKAQLSNEAAAAKAMTDKAFGGNKDTGAYMAALKRLQQQRLNALGQGITNIQKMDEEAKRAAINALANTSLMKYNLDAYNTQWKNAQKPWGDLMGSGMNMWAMKNYLNRLKEMNKKMQDAFNKSSRPGYTGPNYTGGNGFSNYVSNRWWRK